MNIKDAAKILGLSDHVTPETVLAAYRRAAMKYHPDRNPAGDEMMKAVNAAYESLKDYTGDTEQDSSGAAYGDELNAALNVAVNCAGLEIEVCGAWVWISGETRAHKDTLKGAGYRWAPQKKRWYFRPSDWRSFSRGNMDMDEIRQRHGSVHVRATGPRRLAHG